MTASHFGISAKGDILCSGRDEVPLANFSFDTVRPLYDPVHPAFLSGLQVSVRHPDGCSTIFLDITAKDLTGQILRKIPVCRLLQSAARATLDAHLISLVEKSSTEPKTLYFREHGLCQLEGGHWAYVCGDTVLGMPDSLKYQVADKVARAHLAWDPELPAIDAVKELCQRLGQYDHILLPIWGFTIFSSLRSCVRQLNLTTLPSLAIVGGQNLGKTTLAQRYLLLYDDKHRPGRCWAQLDAHSTAAATINQVCLYRDQVVLVDDLARSASAAERRARLELIAEVLRFASNDVGRVRMTSKRLVEERFCQAGLAFTGEFQLDNPSDLTRLVSVELREQLKGGSDDDRRLAATAFHHFLLWLLPRLDEEIEKLRWALDAVTTGVDIRLRKNRMVLLWAIHLFYSFAEDLGAVTEMYFAQALARAETILNGLLDRQRQSVERVTRHAPAGNLSWYILRGYRDNAFHVVPRRKIRDSSDCVVENDALCIRAEALLQFFHTATPYHELTKTDMSRRLAGEGVLAQHKERRAATKKIGGKRYLELHFSNLKAATQAY